MSTREFRDQLLENDRHAVWKISLRIINVVFACVSLICVSWVTDRALDQDYYSAVNILWDTIPLGISIIWNLSNIIFQLIKRRPIHPGANVGVDLALWLAFVVIAVWGTLAALANTVLLTYDDDDDDLFAGPYKTCSGYSACTNSKAAQVRKAVGNVAWAGVVFAYFCLILHFILFVWACVDTHRYNALKANGQAHLIAHDIATEMAEQGTMPTTNSNPYVNGNQASGGSHNHHANAMRNGGLEEDREGPSFYQDGSSMNPILPKGPSNSHEERGTRDRVTMYNS